MSVSMSVTPFQQRVYDAVALIPEGRVSTYKAVAARIRCGAPRAVGQALKRNPFAPRIPCHRVIAADLTPGGFQGETEGPVLHRKVSLLKREGVLFENGRLVEPGRLFTFGKR
jgi:methylated-DNA-[protein]-cysteine S-methyltransferase